MEQDEHYQMPISVAIGRAVLKKAHRIISGNRQREYGAPEDSFESFANMANELGFRRGKDSLNEVDMAQLMLQLKIAREKNKPKFDNMVDACGYAALAAGLQYRAKFMRFYKAVLQMREVGMREGSDAAIMKDADLNEEEFAIFSEVLSDMEHVEQANRCNGDCENCTGHGDVEDLFTHTSKTMQNVYTKRGRLNLVGEMTKAIREKIERLHKIEAELDLEATRLQEEINA